MARRVVHLRGIAALMIGARLPARYPNESAQGGNLGVLVAIAEDWVRRWALPDMPHTRILDAVPAFRNVPAHPR